MKKVTAIISLAAVFAFYGLIYDGMCDTSSERLVYTEHISYREGEEETLTAASFLDAIDVAMAENETSPETTDFPSEFSLTDLGIITKVKTQGDYGTCWAIAATDSIETQLIENGINNNPDLSEWHMAYFAYRGYKPLMSTEENVFNTGGTNTIAAATLSRWQGMITEDKAPYGTMQSMEPYMQYSSDYKVTDVLNVHPLMSTHVKHSVNFMKELIYNHNAVAAAIYSRPEYYNEFTHAHYVDEDGAGIDHAILIVGWDDNYPKENFRSDRSKPEHNGAWLAKNSWGEDWGDNGYFWISYEDKSFCEAGCYYSVSADTYSTNYQYDEAGWCVSISADANQKNLSGYMANTFTAENDDPITAVAFYTTEDDADYEISVYTGTDPSSRSYSPVNGTLASYTTGSQRYTGYHTVNLETPVSVKQGDSFSVVVKLTNHESPYCIPMEASAATVSAGFFSSRTYLFHTFAENETDNSYISLDGQTWYLTTNKRYSYSYPEYLGLSAPLKKLRSIVLGNTCLKAFSSPADSVTVPEEPDPPVVTEPAVTTTEPQVTEAITESVTEPAPVTTPAVTTEPPVTSSPAVTEAPPLEEDIFDINKDGKVNSKDLQYLIERLYGTRSGRYSTDLNEDGKTNIIDLILMKERLTGTKLSIDTSN